jgi:hypothetical protein
MRSCAQLIATLKDAVGLMNESSFGRHIKSYYVVQLLPYCTTRYYDTTYGTVVSSRVLRTGWSLPLLPTWQRLTGTEIVGCRMLNGV